MVTLLYIFLGGGCGCVLRYLVSQASAPLNGSCHFPIGTLICNVLGCFLIGLFNSWSSRFGWSADTKLLLTVGLCGGFTTFSTFSNESITMLQNEAYMSYSIYVISSIVLGLAAVIAGMKSL